MFLGRVVEAGEPEWLPDDRDAVDMVLSEERARNACGHWQWQGEDIEDLEPGYRVCPVCAVMGPYQEKTYEHNRARRESGTADAPLHGLTFGFYPPEEED